MPDELVSDDLIKRLREVGNPRNQKLGPSRLLYREAADALAEMRVELERWQANWDANVQEMSEKFRAVNLAQVMAGTNMDLLERAAAAEAELERVKKALEQIVETVPTRRQSHLPIIAEILDIAARALAPSTQTRYHVR